MTRIRLYAHPVLGVEQFFETPSIGEWLLAFYGEAPKVNVQVFAGEPSEETEVTGDLAALMASDAPEYVVLQTPGSDPGTWLTIISIVFSAASVLLAGTPKMPSNVNRSQQSANNALGSRENQVRLLQRVEDIFGTVKAIPSLMMPTYNKYIRNDKYEYGYYCISRGYIQAEEISDGDTLIADLTGCSAAVYWPFTSPNSGAPVVQIGDAIIDPILTVARSNQVDGITLKPLNQLRFSPDDTYLFSLDGSIPKLQQYAKKPNVNSLVNPGDSIAIAMATQTLTIVDTPAIPPSQGQEGTPAVTHDVSINYTGTYVVTGVGDGLLELESGAFDGFPDVPSGPSILYGYVTADITVVSDMPVSEYTDWTVLKDKDRTEVWVNIVAPNGLVKDNGGQSECSVDFEISIERLDAETLAPTGEVETVTSTISGSVQDERADTIEHATAWTGPARVRMRRTSQHDFDFGGTVIDEIKWADLYSVTPVTKPHFGNKTTIHTITQATSRSTAVKTRQLNTIASRLIPTYDGSQFSGSFDATGAHIAGSIHPTSKLVDIMAAVSLDPKIGNRALADIDMTQIYSVQQQLDAWRPEVGQFNYTFDTDNMSFEESVQTIANAGFCTAYRQNGKIRFALDRPQASSTALFTHRNKKPKSETITRSFFNDSDFDGVQFKYSDPDTQQTETITLPADGSATKLKEFEIPGIRSFAQAWFRANREFYKIKGQRITIETSTTMDARSLLPNARVDIVDNTRFQAYDGEVIGQDGLTLTLSQRVDFVAGESHSIVLMRRDGSVQSLPVSPGANPQQMVLGRAPSEAIVTTQGADGVRTIYSVASDSDRQKMAYLVNEIDLSDGTYATVRGVNYSDAYYQADTAPVPASTSVIN